MTPLISTLKAGASALAILTAFPSLPPSPPLATAKEAAQLQRDVLKSTDPVVQVRWLQADLDRHDPSTSKGNRPYQVLATDQVTFPAVLSNIAAYETRAALPAGVATGLLGSPLYAFNRLRYRSEALNQYGQIQDSMGGKSLENAGVTAVSTGTRFTHVVLGDGGVFGGEDQTRDCSIKTPFQVRLQQLTDLATAIHEEGHLLGRHSATSWKKPADGYEAYLEETRADTYLALRMIGMLGDEGRAYIRYTAFQLTQAAVLAQDKVALEHMTGESLLKVIDYSRHHDLSRKAPAELLELARQIGTPLSRKNYAELEDYVLGDDLPPPDSSTARVYQRQNGLPSFIRRFYGAFADAQEGQQGAAEALHRLNPLRTKGTSAQLSAFDPTYPGEYAATERFNQNLRPATCPPFAEQLAHAKKTSPSP